jgi:hypothetical protein
LEVYRRGLPHLPVDWSKMNGIHQLDPSLNYLQLAKNCIEKPQQSIVYFYVVEIDTDELNENYDKYVKIGVSTNWDNRRAQINKMIEKEEKIGKDVNCTLYAPPYLLGCVEGSYDVETCLHRHWKSYAVGREWFYMTDQMADEIDDLLCDYCICNRCKTADKMYTKRHKERLR